MKKLILSLITILSIITTFADSPITSVVFHTSYSDIPEVKLALEGGKLTTELMAYLSNESNNAAHKLAVINALSWGDTILTTTYENYLLKKYTNLDKNVFNDLRIYKDSVIEKEPYKILNSDELMCWSYLQMRGDYFNPAAAANAAILIIRDNRKPNSQAHVLPLTLILGQVYMDSRDTWCEIYNIFVTNVLSYEYTENKFTEDALVDMVMYIMLYKDYCDN